MLEVPVIYKRQRRVCPPQGLLDIMAKSFNTAGGVLSSQVPMQEQSKRTFGLSYHKHIGEKPNPTFAPNPVAT